MGYLNEVCVGQVYDIDGEEYTIAKIRATNVVSANDFIIAVTFKNKNNAFDTNIKKVIEGKDYELKL